MGLIERIKVWWEGLYYEENRVGHEWRQTSGEWVKGSTVDEIYYQELLWAEGLLVKHLNRLAIVFHKLHKATDLTGRKINELASNYSAGKFGS